MSQRAEFFAICPRGLEALLVEELTAVGARAVRAEAGGVSFAGDMAVGYAANLHSRLASRILWKLGRERYRDEDDIYRVARELPWERHFGPEKTLRLDISGSRAQLASLDFALLRIKDGICDRLREVAGERPSIDRSRPDVRVFAYVDAMSVTLYLDLSGEALFKRGWRAEKGEAPLKENLAAGLLKLSGWTPDQPLLDPFCGSGTIVIEAATIAANRAPGLNRRFAFEKLRGFEAEVWNELREDARAAVNMSAPVLLCGSDISTRVVEQARANARLAGLERWLEDGRLALQADDAREVGAPAPSGKIITNPPYGEQSTPRSASVGSMMKVVADNLKHSFAGWDAWLLTSDRGLPRQMRLSETRKVVLFNGPLECRFFRFELVAGSYRRGAAQEPTPEA